MIQHKTRTEKGQSMVEFAVGMVVLIVLLAGIVDGGRALFTYMALRDAAQEGALFGSVNPTNNGAIQARVYGSSNVVQSLVAGGNTVNVQVNIIGSACSGHGIQVTVSFDNFTLTMPFLGTLIGSQTVGISASATDTILSPACQ
jgi:Flp pilus assembly protein TadG